jgi:hypothetical protein
MIGEMYEKLPVELVMHILKFTPHPLVEVMQVGFRTDPYMICDFCENAIFLKRGNKLANVDVLGSVTYCLI